jgi:hypothetical protein
MNEIELKKRIVSLEEKEKKIWSIRAKKNFSWREGYQVIDEIAELYSHTRLSQSSVDRVLQRLKFEK